MGKLSCFSIIIYLAFCIDAVSAETPTEVKIGFIATLSGPRASLGQDALDGAKLALSEVNEKNTFNVALVIEDSQGDARAGVNAYKKLVAQGIKLVLTQNSNVSLPISELVNKDGVLQLAFSTTVDSYSKPDDLTFRVNGTTMCEAKVMSQFIATQVKKRPGSVGILSMQDEYPASFKKNLESEFKTDGVQVAFQDTFLPKENDYRSLISKLKDKRIDYLSLLSYPTEAGLFLKQARELGFRPASIIGSLPINNKEFFDTAGPAAAGLILTYENFDSQGAIAQKFKANYGREATWFAATGHDAVSVASIAVHKCGSASDVQCLKAGLFSIKKFEGLSGKKAFDDVYGDMDDTCKLMIAKDRQFVDY
jgi:branched-chain amino acid transport system substrate-binding protein